MPRPLLLTLLSGLCAAFLCGCGGGAAPTEPAPDSARKTATVFLDALKNRDGSSAYALLTSDYRERLTEEERKAKAMDVKVVEGEPIAEYMCGVGQLSDSKQQAVFDGGNVTKTGGGFSNFSLVVVKEKDSGEWRVDVFTVKKK